MAFASKIVLMKSILWLSLSAGVLVVVGCQPKSEGPRGAPRTMDTPSQTIVIESEQTDALGRLISDVQTAQSAPEEAEALRRLRKYETDNGLTYATRSFRTYDNAVVADPSVSRDPVRTEVTIFRGRDTLRTFQFVPRDNRNLSALGE
jgi:hypothetical protein